MKGLKRYSIEFLSIFIAVISAFALNNWNENRKSKKAEDKILSEIYFGLQKDLKDIDENIDGHEMGNKAVLYFREIIAHKPVTKDLLLSNYLTLTRDFISIQNTSGYETLKSRGLEIIGNDSLRSKIISLYEYDYNTLRKMEEEYFEMQFQKNYFKEINQIVAKGFLFDDDKNISGFDFELEMSEDEEKIFLTYLWKIQTNRNFILQYYLQTRNKVGELMNEIKAYREN